MTIAVIVMGILLIGGVFLVIGVIVYRVSSRGVPSRPPAIVSLSVEGSVKATALDGDRLAIVVEGPAGETIIIYDLARGRESTRLTIEKPPAR